MSRGAKANVNSASLGLFQSIYSLYFSLTPQIFLGVNGALMLLSNSPQQARSQLWAESPPTVEISQPLHTFPPKNTVTNPFCLLYFSSSSKRH